MRLHRFFVKEKLETDREVVIPDSSLTHQLKKVFRLSAGDAVVLFNGDGFEYVSEISAFEKGVVMFRVGETKESIQSPKINVSLYPSLIKKDKLEWVIQKATEIGVVGFHPVISERSEKKGFDIKRAEKISIEATEQSGWGSVPEIAEPTDLKEALQKAENPMVLESDAPKFSAAKISGQKVVSIFVGPEGGWTDDERKFFKQNKIPLISIGTQTLRAETASVVISALLLL